MKYFTKLFNFYKTTTVLYLFFFFVLNLTNVFANSDSADKSLFRYSTAKGLVGQLYCQNDIIALKRGTLQNGIVDGLFQFSFPFTSPDIALEDIRIVSTLGNTPDKLKIITKEGFCYIGNLSAFNCFYFESEKPLKKKELKLASLDFIFLQPRNENLKKETTNIVQIYLNNGSEFPARIKERKLTFGDDKSQFIVEIDKMAVIENHENQLNFVGLQDSNPITLPPFLVKNRSLKIEVPYVADNIELPWDEISKITLDNSVIKNALASSADIDDILVIGEDIDFADWDEKPTEAESTDTSNEGEDEDLFFISKRDSFINDNLIAFETDVFDTRIAGNDQSNDQESVAEDDEMHPLELMQHKSIKERLEMIEKGPENEIIQQEQEIISEPLLVDEKAKSKKTTINETPKYDDAHDMIYFSSSVPEKAGFYLSRELVTNGDYERFIDAIKYNAPSHWIGGKPPHDLEDKPVVNVSYQDAFLYSIWVGMRLPSKDELQTALDMDKGKVFSAGNLLEWSSSPFTKEIPKDKDVKNIYLREKIIPEHAVFEMGKIKYMLNDEYNHQTGFRVARDAF